MFFTRKIFAFPFHGKNNVTIYTLIEKNGQIVSGFLDIFVFLWTNLKYINMNIGDNLKVIRNKKNISQQDVADYLGIDRKTYVSWESGSVEIKSSYIPKLAEYLQVEINDLFREKGNIIINQHNSDNKDTSINGVILLLSDKEALDQLVDVIKKRFEN
jgi:transcriptional regulator with XRE-family HTH domain